MMAKPETKPKNYEWKLKEVTKQHIERVTGVPFDELLEKEPQVDPRLKKIRRQPRARGLDLLVTGNPELALGDITPIEEIDDYWNEKLKERGE